MYTSNNLYITRPLGPKINIMQNVKFSLTGDKLTIEVDMSKTIGPSKSGKTMVIASTQGNQVIKNDGKPVHMGLNIYQHR